MNETTKSVAEEIGGVIRAMAGRKALTAVTTILGGGATAYAAGVPVWMVWAGQVLVAVSLIWAIAWEDRMSGGRALQELREQVSVILRRTS